MNAHRRASPFLRPILLSLLQESQSATFFFPLSLRRGPVTGKFRPGTPLLFFFFFFFFFGLDRKQEESSSLSAPCRGERNPFAVYFRSRRPLFFFPFPCTASLPFFFPPRKPYEPETFLSVGDARIPLSPSWPQHTLRKPTIRWPPFLSFFPSFQGTAARPRSDL